MLEGILPLELKFLLHHFTAVHNVFTINELNDRIESFQFGYSEKKPSRIESSHLDGSLRQNGSNKQSMYMYIILLTLAFGQTFYVYVHIHFIAS